MLWISQPPSRNLQNSLTFVSYLCLKSIPLPYIPVAQDSKQLNSYELPNRHFTRTSELLESSTASWNSGILSNTFLSLTSLRSWCWCTERVKKTHSHVQNGNLAISFLASQSLLHCFCTGENADILHLEQLICSIFSCQDTHYFNKW